MFYLWDYIEYFMLFIGNLYIYIRILGWHHVIWTSFLAGVLQSLLYTDFIYYFFKSNHNDKIMAFPV